MNLMDASTCKGCMSKWPLRIWKLGIEDTQWTPFTSFDNLVSFVGKCVVIDLCYRWWKVPNGFSKCNTEHAYYTMLRATAMDFVRRLIPTQIPEFFFFLFVPIVYIEKEMFTQSTTYREMYFKMTMNDVRLFFPRTFLFL